MRHPVLDRLLAAIVMALQLCSVPLPLPMPLLPAPLPRNNLGNASAGLGDWQAAADCFGRAAALAPAFSFAAANEALARYQLGQDNRAIKQMRWVAAAVAEGCHSNWVGWPFEGRQPRTWCCWSA